MRCLLSYREVGIVDGREASLKVRRVSLHHIGDLCDMLREFRRLRAWCRRLAIYFRCHLQLRDVLQRLRLKRVQIDSTAALAAQRGTRTVRAVFVGGATLVFARVLRLAVGDIEQNVAEVGDGLDAGGVAQRGAVVEPFDLHVRVSDGLQLTLEVCRVTVLQVLHALWKRMSQSSGISGMKTGAISGNNIYVHFTIDKCSLGF